MKKILASLLIALLANSIAATPFYDQLCEFNFNWKNYPFQVRRSMTIESETEYVQAHLSCVLDILRSQPTGHLDAEQYQSRMQLIGVLDNYRKAGNFPLNYYRDERIPVFIDENGTHCAVAFLLEHTGYEEVALRIAAADNYAWVKDISDPSLPCWQRASGFSMDELKLIQGAYDRYMPGAFTHPDKYTIPQKPEVMAAYFQNGFTHLWSVKDSTDIWCKGEGENGVLNGKWEQNYSPGTPWIIGYYSNGQRTGQWAEYYQGSKQLCRTENWRNDKLNGIRRRLDIHGVLIEEILFRDGIAVTKTNHDYKDSLTWIRHPLDSGLVWTQVFTFGGSLIASGKEKIHNPGNLQWFQNNELTALNSAFLGPQQRIQPMFAGGGNERFLFEDFNPRPVVFSSVPLVQYKKEGEWLYYREYNPSNSQTTSMKEMLKHDYLHFGNSVISYINMFDDMEASSGFDSLRVFFTDDRVENFSGYGAKDRVHLQVVYPLRTQSIEAPASYEFVGTSGTAPSFTIKTEENASGDLARVKPAKKRRSHARGSHSTALNEEQGRWLVKWRR